MAILPCLISECLNHATVSSEPMSAKPRGSQTFPNSIVLGVLRTSSLLMHASRAETDDEDVDDDVDDNCCWTGTKAVAEQRVIAIGARSFMVAGCLYMGGW